MSLCSYNLPFFNSIVPLPSYYVHGPMSSSNNPILRLPKSRLASRFAQFTGGDVPVHPCRNSQRTSSYTVRASNETPPPPPPLVFSNNNNKLILVGSAITITLAVANRVLYKLALVPMKQYPFFLAQFTTFGYVVIYLSILYGRYRAGIVINEMIAIPKSPFIVIGMLEALGVVTGMSAAAMLPGPAIPILNQTFLVFQLTFSAILLGRRYSFIQISGCLLVAIGVAVAVSSGSGTDQMLLGVEFIWPAIMIISTAFQAGASIIKEFVFVDASKRLKGKSLDIFVVNSFGSGFQALFVLIFLPVLSNLKGIPFSQLPSYLMSGAGCFLNIGGRPVVASLGVTLSVPIAIYIMSLPLPYHPEGAVLSPYFLVGSVILVLGLVLFNVARPIKQASD
ncbi:protein CLT2, chloroplastic isoform X2 [Euphorbia lathyris]|uniref:protein CLT2, chloroplastic isoform X2 n=1 Tax=Euphorbia lathyris TaxID=212925 RepID=UPI0033142083